MRNTMRKAGQEKLNREKIEQILKEEDLYFKKNHHRSPIGRESEDVVDNAYTRILHIQKMPYIMISNIYCEMRCSHA